MRKELDYADLFARWGKPGEKLDDEWREDFLQTIQVIEGRVVACQLNNAVLAGGNGVYLFRGVYISWDVADTFLGPYKTFEEAAEAAEVFSVGDVTESIWVDPRVILNRKVLPPPSRSARRSSVSARRSPSSARQSKKLTIAWEKAAKEFTNKMCASGRAVRVWTQPIGRKRFLAIFVPTSVVMRKALGSDRGVVLGTVRQDGDTLQYAAEKFKADREIVLAAVNQQGMALRYAAKALQSDREIVLAAVNQNGYALEYAAEKLKADREIVLAAVNHFGWALEHAAEPFKADREIVLAAVNEAGTALQYAADALQSDREIVLASVRQNGAALKYAANALQSDREFVLVAVRQTPSALDHAAEKLKADREILLAAHRRIEP